MEKPKNIDVSHKGRAQHNKQQCGRIVNRGKGYNRASYWRDIIKNFNE